MYILKENEISDKLLKESNNTIRKTDSGTEEISWKEFIDHYNNEKIKKVQYFPYAYTNKSGCKVFIEIVEATIDIEGYNTLRICNQKSQICIESSEIILISEAWSRNNAEVLMRTKTKGHLSIQIR